MAAITWRQLVSPDDSGAFKALHAAGDTINTGFDAVNRAITSRQLANQTQEDIGRKTNISNYLDAVQQASTPEAAAALQSSPEMKALGASVDPRDRDLVRNAIEARLTSTRQNVTAGQTFQDTQTAWDSRDSVNAAFNNALASKDPAKIQSFMESIPVNHPARVDLGIKLAGLVQGNTKFASDMDTAKVTQDATQSNAAATTKNADTNAVQAKTQQQQADTQTFNSRQAAYENAQKFGAVINEKLANHNKGIIGSPEGQEAYTKNLSEVIADKDKLEKYMGVVAQAMSKNPLFAKLPTDEVVRVATQEVNNLGVGFWNAFNPLTDVSSTVRDRIVGELGKSLEANKDRIGKSELAFSKLLTQSELHKGVIEDTYRAAFPTGGAALDAQIATRQAKIDAGTSLAPGSPTPGAPQPVNSDAKGTPAPSAQQAMMDKRIALEQVKIALGEQKDFSPEVRKYMVEQNWQAAKNGGRAVAAGGVKLGAAFNDLVTLPVRGVAGAVNSVLSVPNSLGANLPTIPDNGWLSSMTPYSDRLSGQSSREDLIKQRNELERSIKDASKKAK